MLFLNLLGTVGTAWICEKCGQTVHHGLRCTNLCCHINTKHKSKITKSSRANTLTSGSDFDTLTYPRKNVALQGSLECVILGLQLLSLMAHAVVHWHIKHHSICMDTLVRTWAVSPNLWSRRYAPPCLSAFKSFLMAGALFQPTMLWFLPPFR